MNRPGDPIATSSSSGMALVLQERREVLAWSKSEQRDSFIALENVSRAQITGIEAERRIAE